MVDYKTFKKEYLNEWVDRSQAARKAAEELAMKEVKPSLRDRYKPQNVIMTLNGKRVEFKGENEKKPNGDIYFTYEEAKECFGEPNKDGWRLPTYEELEALIDSYPYDFDEDNEQGIFDKRLFLLAAGYRHCYGNVNRVGFAGIYWSSTSEGSDNAWYFYFGSDGVYTNNFNRCFGLSVCLVRDVK